MNTYPTWKYLVLIVVIIVGVVFALPNIYGDDPAIQISARGGTTNPEMQQIVQAAIESSGVEAIASEFSGDRALIRYANTEDQLRAQDHLLREIGERYVVALNLAPATPGWLRQFAQPMFLGLDLRGGVHFLMEVDMVSAIKQAEERYADDLRATMREENIRYRGVRYVNDQLEIRFRTAAVRDSTVEVLESEYRDLLFTTRDDGDKYFIDANLTEEAISAERTAALQQNVVTLRNRVNELGVAEPVIQRQGADRIVVQLPGIQDTGRAKQILGATATLEYRLVHGTASDWYSAQESGQVPGNARLYKMRDDGTPVLLKRQVIVTGDQIEDASAGIDQQSGSPAVFVNLDGKGAKKMQRVSSENIGNLMAVVFIENRVDTKENADGEIVKVRRKVEEVINAATIRDVLSHRFQTTGLDSTEARNLALLLRAGALKAPVEIVEERTVGPSLGQDNIDQGLKSVIIGLSLVLVFMLVYYRVFGIAANIALTLNLVLIVAVLSMLQATLTLPGIAGIVLTVGMAVDANVLIFERVREELRAGASTQSAISGGYEKAFSTIADANVTTLIAAIVLFSFGTGPIKGFAITLSIGIVTSMFTAIFGTRALINAIYGGRKVAKLSI